VFWVWLSRLWQGWRQSLRIIKPETVIAWNRKGFRLYWTWKSRTRMGRPCEPREIRQLIRRELTKLRLDLKDRANANLENAVKDSKSGERRSRELQDFKKLLESYEPLPEFQSLSSLDEKAATEEAKRQYHSMGAHLWKIALLCALPSVSCSLLKCSVTRDLSFVPKDTCFWKNAYANETGAARNGIFVEKRSHN
jgi:hypothetical protein